jgi:transketolase
MTKDQDLKKIARQIKINIIKMIAAAGSGHPAGSLGIVDILVALYFKLLKHNPKNPEWENRDRFLLSAGHLCPALYATLAAAGYFPQEELMTLRALGSRLQGHSHRNSPPGVEISAGSLGQGLSVTCGMALGAKLDKKNYKIICLTSDGEHDEGQVWEAAMFATKYKLSNIVQIIDRNHIQIDGTTETIMPIEPLKDKYQAFGWQTLKIDGHDFEQIIQAYTKANASVDKPTVIIAKTIPGKGVSFMEGKWEWHGKAPTQEEAEKAIKELEENA